MEKKLIIDPWVFYYMKCFHGHSPFKPHKPLFYDKDVINNIKFHKSIIFNNQLSKECIELINHLVD